MQVIIDFIFVNYYSHVTANRVDQVMNKDGKKSIIPVNLLRWQVSYIYLLGFRFFSFSEPLVYEGLVVPSLNRGF